MQIITSAGSRAVNLEIYTGGKNLYCNIATEVQLYNACKFYMKQQAFLRNYSNLCVRKKKSLKSAQILLRQPGWIYTEHQLPIKNIKQKPTILVCKFFLPSCCVGTLFRAAVLLRNKEKNRSSSYALTKSDPAVKGLAYVQASRTYLTCVPDLALRGKFIFSTTLLNECGIIWVRSQVSIQPKNN